MRLTALRASPNTGRYNDRVVPDSVGSRLFDLAVVVPLLILTFPLMVLASIAIIASDGWPPIYGRRVLGKYGREFTAYKLRTMLVDGDYLLHKDKEAVSRYLAYTKLDNDPRVTRVGRVLRRLHFDELPQLFNVLAAQMSMVGPRMIHAPELPKYGEFGPARLSVRPGVTGLWQVTKSGYEYDERLLLDRYYLARRSLVFDVKIIVATIPSILGWRVNLASPSSIDAQRRP